MADIVRLLRSRARDRADELGLPLDQIIEQRGANTIEQMLEALTNLENDDGRAMPASAWTMVQDAIEAAGGKRKDG